MAQQPFPPVSGFLRLPNELLEAIAFNLATPETLAFGLTCRRFDEITSDTLLWRRRCLQTWLYWHPRHEIDESLQLPPIRTKWRHLYQERVRDDSEALAIFDRMLSAQKDRSLYIQEIAAQGYAVKDLLLKLKDETPDSADDVLARRYYAASILGHIHRAMALDKWGMLQQGQPVAIEDALGAYDLFIISGGQGDIVDIRKELDRIADAIREAHRDIEQATTRQKAIAIAGFLRSKNLVGNPIVKDYHALRNNFLSKALFDDVHASLPLQSVAIYCAVAQRLGLDARPSNYPRHVHAVVQAPPRHTLEGAPRDAVPESQTEHQMHMDPWNSSEETPHEELRAHLAQMGIPQAQQDHHLGPSSMTEIVLRTGRNIMTSVEEARRRRLVPADLASVPEVDIDKAWYSMLWSMLLLGADDSAAAIHRRRQVLPYVIEHYQTHFQEDIALVKRIPPLFAGHREEELVLTILEASQKSDASERVPKLRVEPDSVRYKVGLHFRHKNYDYHGFIVGWDPRCSAGDDWIRQMRVDDLPGGREQPFYHIVAEDKSARYVAQENIEALQQQPSPTLIGMAGRYFKRWDEEKMMFESNVRDQYPHD